MEEPLQSASSDVTAARVRRFSVRLTIGCIVIGNALFLIALWGSGLDLDRVFGERDRFDPTRDDCLRMAWYLPQGEKDPVRLCKEWINLTDSSGQVHTFDQNLEITKSADGKVYAHGPTAGDGRIIALLLAVLAIVATGMWAERFLITRYRARLMATAKDS